MRRLFISFVALSLIVVGLLVPASASALEWDRLWLNDNQRGERNMEDGHYASAAATFTDPLWKAAALYRAGEYQEAAEAWQQLDDVDAHYNRGNALARTGDLQGAVDAYETVLERDPGHQDARYNLELLRSLMQDSNNPQSSDEQRQQETESQEHEPGQDQSGGQQSEQRNEQSGESESSQNESEPMNKQQRREQQATDDSNRETQQAGQPESSDLPERDQEQVSRRPDELADSDMPERQAAMEQWLRRIPDDPGGLMRRKFLYQYSNRHRRKERVEEPW